MKTLSDIKRDMSTLYDELRDGKVELKLASELANIAGKNLKAEQLELARAIFLSNSGTPAKPIIGPFIASDHLSVVHGGQGD